MNKINNKYSSYKNIFFFFIDSQQDTHDNFLNTKIFQKISDLAPVKYFSVFNINKIDFDFLEKNEKLIFFFLIFNELFFKTHIKNLKNCLNAETNLDKSFLNLKIKFFLNFFFFNFYIYNSIFLLKKIALKKSYNS
jgi:hypothetical protein